MNYLAPAAPMPNKQNCWFQIFASFFIVLLSTQLTWYASENLDNAQLFSITFGAMTAVSYVYGRNGVFGQFLGLLAYYTFVYPIPSGVGYLYSLAVTGALFYSVDTVEKLKKSSGSRRWVFCLYVFLVPGVGSATLAMLAPSTYTLHEMFNLYLTDAIGALLTGPLLTFLLLALNKPKHAFASIREALRVKPTDFASKAAILVGILLVLKFTDTIASSPYLSYLLLAPLVTLAIFNFSELAQIILVMIGFGQIFYAGAYDDIHTLNTRLSLFFMFSLIMYVMLEYKQSLRCEIEKNMRRLYFDSQSNFGTFQKLDAQAKNMQDFMVAALDLRSVFKFPLEKRDRILRQLAKFFEYHTDMYEQCHMLYDVSALVILTENSDQAVKALEALQLQLDDYLEKKNISYSLDKIYYCRCRKGIRIKHAVNKLNVHIRLKSGDSASMVVDCDGSELDNYITFLEELNDKNIQILRQDYLSLKSPSVVCFELLSSFSFEGNKLNTATVFHCAQRLGYLEQLEEAVVMRQLNYLKHLPSDSYEYGSVNLTPDYLSNPRLVSALINWVTVSGIETHKVNIEVVESGSIDQPEMLLQNLNALKENGFRLALDDFGAGHATYNHLLTMPIDTVKIDGSLVLKCISDPIKRKIIEDLRDIADILKISIVAECVETEEKANFLKELGIDYIQGYFHHKPEPVREQHIDPDMPSMHSFR